MPSRLHAHRHQCHYAFAHTQSGTQQNSDSSLGPLKNISHIVGGCTAQPALPESIQIVWGALLMILNNNK